MKSKVSTKQAASSKWPIAGIRRSEQKVRKWIAVTIFILGLTNCWTTNLMKEVSPPFGSKLFPEIFIIFGHCNIAEIDKSRGWGFGSAIRVCGLWLVALCAPKHTKQPRSETNLIVVEKTENRKAENWKHSKLGLDRIASYRMVSYPKLCLEASVRGDPIFVVMNIISTATTTEPRGTTTTGDKKGLVTFIACFCLRNTVRVLVRSYACHGIWRHISAYICTYIGARTRPT